MADLSILIPARNEMFLARTVQDILDNIVGDTEIIVVLDGAWADPSIPVHPRVTVVYHAQSIGQRATANEAARISTAKYVMKVDAHCAFDKGFDAKLMADCQPDWTVIPRMYNLHAFDWVCQGCGNRTYQGGKPEKCERCGGTVEMEMVWKPRLNRRTDFARFDADLHFQYWREYERRPEAQREIEDVMCFVGAAFFMERERYWELGGLDEGHGSWGQMGVEISCKSWLSGGRMVVNKRTWFAHLFRTQPGFGFPYPMSGGDQDRARAYSREMWLNDRWDGAVKSLSWLIEKFSPVPGWDDSATKGTKCAKEKTGIVYYTDNRLDGTIQLAVWAELARVGLPVVSVSLKPIPFGKNIVLEKERGYLTMFEQILAGLEASEAEIIFFCEHDVLYHPTHFEYIPPRRDVFYYNENVWKVDSESGRSLFYYARQTSGLVAYRELLLEHYRKRVAMVRENGFSRKMGFEPGTHSRTERVDDYKAEGFMSACPNVDIRHGLNLTPSRWSRDQFRDQRYTRGWTESNQVPGWGVTLGRFEEFINKVLT